LATTCWAAGHDQLTNAPPAAWFGKQKPRYGSDAGLVIRAQGSGPSKLRERLPASRSNPPSGSSKWLVMASAIPMKRVRERCGRSASSNRRIAELLYCSWF
jgi:hypothetical protein